MKYFIIGTVITILIPNWILFNPIVFTVLLFGSSYIINKYFFLDKERLQKAADAGEDKFWETYFSNFIK